MAVLSRLSNPNKIENFERMDWRKWPENHEKAYDKALELLKKTDFNAFDQSKCWEFMAAHGKELLHLYTGNAVGDLCERLNALEEVLVRQGLFGGEFSRVPSALAGTVLQTQSSPYTIVRLICRQDGKDRQILARMEDETILLRKNWQIADAWRVEMYWRKVGSRHIELPDRLSFSYERFLRFSMKFEAHFKIEKAALEVLSHVLSNNPKELVMQYAGYPTEAEKQGAEKVGVALQAEAGWKGPIELELPKEEAAPAAQPPVGRFQRLKNWAGSWF